MSRKLLPSASVYKAVLPAAEFLEKHLAELAHVELPATAPSGSGFIAVEPGTELVYEFNGGLAFSLRIDEKIVPGGVVKAELKKWSADYEEREGAKPGRKLLREAREMLVVALTSRALVRTKVVTCLYHIEKELLFIPSISKKVSNTVMKQLVRAVESLKTTTVHVSEAKGSLTTRLENYMAESDVDAFEGFSIGERLILVGPNGKSSFDLTDLTGAMHGIREAIASGAQVSEISLSSHGVHFRLTYDFLLKGITFADGVAAPADQDEEGVDEHVTFSHEATCQMLLVSAVVADLLQMFGYVPPVEDDGSDLS